MVPSLVSYCLQALVPYADQVSLPVPLRIRPHDTILDDLVPDPATIDPKLWAVLIQVYDVLPPFFAQHTLPLSDSNVPLFQSLSPTPYFSLITLLNLSCCPNLADESILLFKSLHTLIAFDASSTALTSYAIHTLAAILQSNQDPDAARTHRGPWELRILSLRNCKRITDDVYPYLHKFPLLSVVDLRGTGCTPQVSSPFKSCPKNTFHHPSSLISSLAALQDIQPNLTISTRPYILNIDALQAPEPKKRPLRAPTVGPQDAFVVIPSNPARPIKIGNIYALERQNQARKDQERHEINKEAWYARQERLEARHMDMYGEEDEESGCDDEFELRMKNLKREREVATFIKSLSHHPKDATLSSLLGNGNAHAKSQTSSTATNHRHPSSTRPRLPISTPRHRTALNHGLAHSQRLNYAGAHNEPPSNHPLRVHQNSATRAPLTVTAFRRATTERNGQVPEHRRPTMFGGNAARLASSSIPSQAGPTGSTRLLSGDHLVQSAAAAQRSTVNACQAAAGATTTAEGPSVSASNFYQPQSARVSISALKARKWATREDDDDDEGDIALRLYRDPPPYSHLIAVLDPTFSKNSAGEEKPPIDRCASLESLPAKASLNETAIVDKTRAERALNALKVALKSRMPSASSSSSTMAVFEDGSSASGKPRLQRSASVLTKRRLAVPMFESSFDSPDRDNIPTPASRNPFRKRASLPSGTSDIFTPSGFGAPTAQITPPLKSVSGTPKAVHKSSSLSSVKAAFTSAPASTSASANGKSSVHRSSMAVATPVSAKPLIPISAVKVPILPDDVRRAALAREEESMSASVSARKRRRVQHDQDEASDEEYPQDNHRGVLKERSCSASAGRANMKAKEKDKGKSSGKEKGVFDWKSWSKK